MSDLGGFLQENLLVLLSYDKDKAPLIRGSIDVSLFSGNYREIAVQVYDFLDRYGEPPRDHLADILEHKLQSKNKREVRLYSDILNSIYEAKKEGVNSEYVMSQLETFVTRQSLRTIAVDLSKALQRDTEESLEEAQRLISNATSTKLQAFDPGTQLSDPNKALEFLYDSDDVFPTGIPELDKYGFGPVRKELLILIADKKKGKSWFLAFLAKITAMHRLKVVHITLEMSERRNAQRYMMAFFALAKRKETVKTKRFKRNEHRVLVEFEDRDIEPQLTLDDPGIAKKLEKKIKRWAHRYLKNIFIKEFPTGSLTIQQLNAYLDNLEASHHFTPDLILVDYPDLMKVDKTNIRISISELIKDLRGIGVKRNCAMVAVSQSHRSASDAQLVKSKNVAEDYSKAQNADLIITYSQTENEKKLGLARLHVDAGRNDQDAQTIIISQAYAIGQFVVDSALMIPKYFDRVKAEVEGDTYDEDDEDED